MADFRAELVPLLLQALLHVIRRCIVYPRTYNCSPSRAGFSLPRPYSAVAGAVLPPRRGYSHDRAVAGSRWPGQPLP
jgi:hypothetical protein